MRWCRIRLVLLGLLLCVVHVVSGTCGQRFTDPASSAVLADIVFEGKVRMLSEPDSEGVYNITVAIRKNILKGSHLINKGRSAKTVTVQKFKSGGKDDKNCIGSVQKVKTYIFFLRNTTDTKGLHFEITALPVKKSKKIMMEIRKVLCNNCAKAPSIGSLTGKKQAEIHGNMTFTCVVEGNPLPEISWYQNGVQVKGENNMFKIRSRKRQSTLQIKRIRDKDSGSYECVAVNVLGEARMNASMDVVDYRHATPCDTQTYCLNGGTCMLIPRLGIYFCKCPEMWAGHRCQMLDGIAMKEDYNRQATLVMERTLIIVGIVVAVLVFIVICIASYILAKKGRKQLEQRRNRNSANRSDNNRDNHNGTDHNNTDHNSTHHDSTDNSRSIVCVNCGHVSQVKATNESDIRLDTSQPNQVRSQSQHILLQDCTSPPLNKPLHGHQHNDFLHQQPLTNVKVHRNEYRPEPRSRLDASSTTEEVELLPFISSKEGRRNTANVFSPNSEKIEMRVLHEAPLKSTAKEKRVEDQVTKNNSQIPQWDYHLTSSSQPSPEPSSSASLSPQTNLSGNSPLLLPSSTTPSQTLPPCLNSPSQEQPQPSNESSYFLNENDPSVQPLLLNHKQNFPLHRNINSQRVPFESKSDKDLSRYLPMNINKPNGKSNDSEDKKHLLRKLSGLSHSNTFPKTKENGLPADTFSDSEEDNELEIPYQRQSDLYISEDDLNLSKENLVSSSFSSVNTTSRQASIEERGLGLLSKSGSFRPAIRKHQSEEGPPIYKIVNKSHAYLQENARSQSLDNPPTRAEGNQNPHHFNSTVAGSPDVDTYESIAQQPLQSQQMYSYDPNEDPSPWEGEVHRNGNNSSGVVDERDRLNRLKDVLPDQQAIPI